MGLAADQPHAPENFAQFSGNPQSSVRGKSWNANVFKPKIFVDPSACPRLWKAHSVPYSMHILVYEKLEQLVKGKVIEPVQHVDKKTVQICYDFKG